MAKVFRLYFHLHLTQAMFMCVCVVSFLAQMGEFPCLLYISVAARYIKFFLLSFFVMLRYFSSSLLCIYYIICFDILGFGWKNEPNR